MTIPLPNGKEVNLALTKNAIAEESNCDKVLTAIDENIPQYTAGSLGVFNRALYYLNNRNSADVENIFCHFVNTMGLDGEVADPVTKDLEGTTKVRVTVVAAASSGWQSDAGYSKKATVEVAEDGSTFVTYMVIYWGFSGSETDTTKTKGFLIEGSPKNGLSGTRPDTCNGI